MAEANSRPILPASAKAVSMVAASTSQSTIKGNQLQAVESSSSQQQQRQQQQPAIEAGKQRHEEEEKPQKQRQQQAPLKQASSISDSSSSSISALGSVTSTSSTQQQQQHQVVTGPRSPPTSQSSITSSFVSSESITSNLRKMIVSSSATIGRKFNISSSSSSSQNSSNTISNNNNSNHSQQQLAAVRLQQQGQQQRQQHFSAIQTLGNSDVTSTNITMGTNILSIGKQQSAVAGGSVSDFETRQANYKHPVIQSDPRPKSAGSRFKQAASSDTSFLRQNDNSSELKQQLSKDIEGTSRSECNQASSDSPSQLSRLTQPNEGLIKR